MNDGSTFESERLSIAATDLVNVVENDSGDPDSVGGSLATLLARAMEWAESEDLSFEELLSQARDISELDEERGT